MTDRSAVDRVIAANRYAVLGTADESGSPWVSPVFFAPLGSDRFCWVSSPGTRHSRNIERRPSVAITVFDSTVGVGHAEAAYFEAVAGRAAPEESAAALGALNARLPAASQLTDDDVRPRGPMAVYVAELQHRYVLVRGGDPEYGNVLDMTLEV